MNKEELISQLNDLINYHEQRMINADEVDNINLDLKFNGNGGSHE